MSLASDLRDTVLRLTPIDTAIASFERGGPQRGRDIERLYAILLEVEGVLRDSYEELVLGR